jgi:tripartite-type tricarboxylate transporter receptor subunit TctC
MRQQHRRQIINRMRRGVKPGLLHYNSGIAMFIAALPPPPGNWHGDTINARTEKMKTLLKISSILLLLASCGPAFAQAYPEKAVRVVVPFPPGGAADIIARHVAQRLTGAFGVQFVVDNRGGAGGAIGTEMVARAAPDGYVLLIASSSSMAINPHMTRNQTYNPITSFTPIILVGYTTNALVAHPSVPARTVKELIVVAKAKPQSLTFASNGTGTLSHLTGELFMQRAGVSLLHVPYKGAAPAAIDTMAGQTSLLFAAYPSVVVQIASQKLRGIAVTSAKRIEFAPDLPTVAETLPGFESNQWWGFYGPAGLPQALVARLNGEANKILRSPDIKQRLANDGALPSWGTPAELAAYLKADFDRWGTVVKAAGIKPE